MLRESSSSRNVLLALLGAFALLVGGATSAAPVAVGSGSALVVRYVAVGDSAVTDCAERIWQNRQRFADMTADRSDSLDHWHTRHEVTTVRAIFRHNNRGASLVHQTRELADRLGHGMARRRDRETRSANSSGPSGRERIAALSSARRLAPIYRIEFADSVDLAAAMAELQQDPHVDFVQPDYRNQLDFEPNDPFLTSEGSWSQPYPDLWGLERIGAFEAWQTTRGAGQIVAVVDTGLDYEHPDIAANAWINPGEDLDGNDRVDASDWNGLDDDDNGFVDDLRGYDFAGFGDVRPDGTTDLGDPDPFDENGHGTHVAGIVAATANNGIGIAGVAPEAQLMPLKGFPSEGPGRDSDLWRAVLYAVENGADVINASWSCSPACPVNPLAREVLANVEAAGVVFVTSAGNSTFDVVRNDPENSTAAITVGSIGADDVISGFSNRGWLVDLIAPGGGPSSPQSVRSARRNILSLAASSLGPLEEAFVVGGAYWRQAGTSMAAPYVTGAIALLRSVRPDLEVGDIRRLLRSSAEDLLPTGHDPIHGAGLLDVPALLEAELPDLQLQFEALSPGEIFDPTTGPVALQFVATGSDLISYSVAFSQGLETNVFEEIGSGEAFDGSAILAWPVESLSDGPYVLRLRATLRGGVILDEFGIVGLERNRPRRLSSGRVDEQQPSISGRSVAWRSRVDRSVNRGQIRAGGFGRGRGELPVFTLSETQKSQRDPIVSGHNVVWLENAVASFDDELRGCQLRRGAASACHSQLLAANPDEGRLDPIGLAKGQLVWSSRVAGLFDVLGCVWRGGRRCLATEVTVPRVGPISRRLLDFDGRTLLLSSTGSPSGLEICRPVFDGAPCTPQLVKINGSPITVERASLDGTLLAFEIFRPVGSLLGYCQLDLETADCRDVRPIETLGSAVSPDVSGRRIVWSEDISGEEPSIAFCEWDSLSGECARTRLTGSTAPAGVPKIDGHRVVWQDARLGPDQIFGLELPRIWLPNRIAVRADRPRIIPVAAADPAGGLLQLELVGHSGLSPEMMGAKIVSLSDRWAAIVIEGRKMPDFETAVWQLLGTGRGGLMTRETLEITVTPSSIPPHAPGRRRPVTDASPRTF
jgi:subtilisin family serine protease